MWFRNIFHAKGSRRAPVKAAPGQPETLLAPQVLRQLDHLQLEAGRWLPGRFAGLRSGLRRKASYDFRDHRTYVPGDDARYIDWKASARQEHVFVRQGEIPRDVPVFLLLDASLSMTWGTPPKSRTLLQLAAALGYLALAHGDRLHVLPFAGRPLPPLGPLSGKGQVPALLRYLQAVPFDGRSDIQAVIERLAGRFAPGGLVLLLSDLLNVDGLQDGLRRLREPAWDVAVLQLLHPQEIQPVFTGDVEMLDMETGQCINYDLDAQALQNYRAHLREWQTGLEWMANETNAAFLSLETGTSLERAILPQLVAARILRRA